MSSTFEKSVKGATKIKLAPPKSKYIEHILQATRAGEQGVAEVFRVLTLRLRDSTWTIAFKALIVVHLMIREGAPEATLSFLSSEPRKAMSVSTFASVQTQGRNINHYSRYLIERAMAFQKSKVDFVLNGRNRLKSLSVDKGLLRETEIVQDQIQTLLKCDLFTVEMENEITITAFRLLTMDLLVLYQVMNEGTICVLEHYFEMSKPDAERSLSIYKTFTKHTEAVVRFLAVARDHQEATQLTIPKLKHAPTSLAASLEEYLNDRDFETNRRQYIAQQQAKKGIKPTTHPMFPSDNSEGKAGGAGSKFPDTKAAVAPSSSQPVASKPKNGPAPDLIDFFDSIEQNQQPMAQDSTQFHQQAFAPNFVGFAQPTGQQGQMRQLGAEQPGSFAPQATGNPFMHVSQQPQQTQYTPQPQIQPHFTGAGFGGYTAQPQQQAVQPQYPQPAIFPQNGGGFDQFGQQPFDGLPSQQIQEQTTNPFRKSMMPNQTSSPMTGSPMSPSGKQGGSNPFSRTNTMSEENTLQQFDQPYATQVSYSHTPPPQQMQNAPPLQIQPTGTNPFARAQSPLHSPSPQSAGTGPSVVMPTSTGTTNPFKHSAFVNQQTGQGWQTSPQNLIGGLERLETVPVFPRPGQPQQQFQQPFPQQPQNQSPGQ